MKYNDETLEDEVLERYIASFTSAVSNGHYRENLKELQGKIPFDSGMTAGLCQGLRIAYEHRQRLQQEIQSILKQQIFNIPERVPHALSGN